MTGTLAAGLILGIAESIVLMMFGASWAPAVAFGLLLVVLGIRPQGLFRAMKFWIGVARSCGAVAIGCWRWPRHQNEYFFFAAFVVLQFMVLATAWNILGGYAGYVNFGTAAFFGHRAPTPRWCCSSRWARRSRCRSSPRR